jgi:hypothetical protein
MKKIIEQSKELLPDMGYLIYPKPAMDKETGVYGYFFKSMPDTRGVKELWFGLINNKDRQGVFLGATPATHEGTRKLMDEGYKLSPSGKPQLFLKRLISEKNIRKWLKAPKAEKDKMLKCIIENTYPF